MHADRPVDTTSRIFAGSSHVLIRPWNGAGRLKVYEAEHLRHSEPRIVLIAPSETLPDARRAQAWVSGARAATALAHPYLLRLAAAGVTEDGGAYAAYPMVPHRTARQLLEQSGPLDIQHACDVALCVLSALQLAHASEVLHGAIGIDTVLVAQTPVTAPLVQLIGLGPCAAMEPLAGPQHAPERLTGSPLTERGDVYSVAVLLVSLLAPEAGGSAREWVSSSDLPEALKDTLLSALDPDPLARQPTARLLAGELLGFAGNPSLFQLRIELPAPVVERESRVAIHPNTMVRSERAGFAPSDETAREILRAAIIPSAPTVPQVTVPRGQTPRPRVPNVAAKLTPAAAVGAQQLATLPGARARPEALPELAIPTTGGKSWLSPQRAAVIMAAGFGAGLWVAWLSGLI